MQRAASSAQSRRSEESAPRRAEPPAASQPRAESPAASQRRAEPSAASQRRAERQGARNRMPYERAGTVRRPGRVPEPEQSSEPDFPLPPEAAQRRDSFELHTAEERELRRPEPSQPPRGDRYSDARRRAGPVRDAVERMQLPRVAREYFDAAREAPRQNYVPGGPSEALRQVIANATRPSDILRYSPRTGRIED